MAELGIVIPSHNRRENLCLTLASLKTQTWNDFQVVIADDGSSDDTRGLVEELAAQPFWSGRLKWVGCSRNRGGRRGRARNVGVANLSTLTRHLMFLDSDIVLSPSSLDSLWRLFYKNPEATVFGMVEWLPPMAASDIARSLEQGEFQGLRDEVPSVVPDRLEGTFVGPELRQAHLFDDQAIHMMDGRWALYTNTAMPIDLFERVGGFDERMEGYGFEDMEFGLRCQAQGTECIYSPECIGLHVWHAKPSSDRNHLENQRNLSYVLEKHGWNDYFSQQIDWSLWWHYRRKSGAILSATEQGLFALDRSRVRRLTLPDETWVERLGFSSSEVDRSGTVDYSSVEDFGIANLFENDITY